MKSIIGKVFSLSLLLLVLVSCMVHVEEPQKIIITYKGTGQSEFIVHENTVVNTALTVDDGKRFNYGCHVIESWNTASDGSGVSYEPGKEYVFTSDTVLYAEWGIHHLGLTTKTSLEPTCTKTGIRIESCSVCNYEKKSEIPMTEHQYIENYSEDYIVRKATCTEPAVYYKSCANCGKNSEETFSSKNIQGHIMSDHKGKEATCTSDGWKPYEICSICGYSTYEEIKAYGHDKITHEASPSTCTVRGWTEYETCSRCSYNTREDLDLLPHTYVEVIDKKYLSSGNPCVDNALYFKSCSECGIKGEETFTLAEPFGHDYQNYRCTRCTLWNKGPAGGYVFYDCDADNTDTDPDGADNLKSSVCGWRFLEVAPSDISGKYRFGYYRETPSSEPSISDTRSSIGSGKSNFDLLLQKYEGHTYNETGNTPLSDYALKACDEYYVVVDGVKYDDWFIPSKDELLRIYEDLYKNGLITLKSGKNDNYWSTTEFSHLDMYSLLPSIDKEGIPSRCNQELIRPVRAFI